MLHFVLQISSLKRWKKAAITRKKSVTWNMKMAAWGVSWYWQVRVATWPFMPWLSGLRDFWAAIHWYLWRYLVLSALQFNKSISLVCHSSVEAISEASAGTLYKILWKHKVHQSDYTGRTVSDSGFSLENVETFSSLLLSSGDGFGLGSFNTQALVNNILLSI